MTDFARTVQDTLISGYDKYTADSTHNLSINIQPSYRRGFSKNGRLLEIKPAFTMRFQKGRGLRYGKQETGISNEWLTNTKTFKSFAPSLSVAWREPLRGKASLGVSLSSRYDYDDSENIYFDVIQNEQNFNNTKDYATNKWTNAIGASFRYGQQNYGFSCVASVALKNVTTIGTERRYGMAGNFKNYLFPNITAYISYLKGENSLTVNYVEREVVPSYEATRPVINDANPLYLRAGNPDLRQSLGRFLELKYGHSFPKNYISLNCALTGSYASGALTNKTTYYSTETILPDFNYTVPAGSCVIQQVNLSGKYSLSSSVSYEQLVSKINSAFSLELSARTSKSPYYTADVLHNLTDVSFNITAGKDSNYSITLSGNDLSNTLSSKKSLITDEYTGWSHSLYLGRNVLVSFRYIFSKR